ncbi:MAG: biopolymer transporter Tol [Verrucomicrobiota bacterium]|nr:biopolymer transporter Tol [Verrucomicrobiota bacterium]
MKRLLALALALFPAAIAPAQEPPTITISKADKLSIAVSGLPAAEAKTLKNDLALSGYFNVTPATSAAFVAGGTAGGGSLTGNITDRSGKVVLTKTYTGSTREKVHQFADDIVETLTGNRGIASTRMAFVATRSGHKEIYVCDADGGNVTQLTHDASISVAPHLSPDGRRLVYTGYKSGYADVYEIDLASGARNRIIKFPGTNSGAAFSPQGDRLAVTLSKDGNPELYVMSARGGGARRLTRTAGVESSPTWSPEGDEIIYSSDDRGAPQLYRIPASGGTGRLMSTGQGYCTEPDWSPDGRKVAFNSRGGGSFLVAILDLAGGSTRTLGEGQDPVWGADSRHLVYSSGGALILLDAQTGQKTTLVSGLGKVSEPSWSR